MDSFNGLESGAEIIGAYYTQFFRRLIDFC